MEDNERKSSPMNDDSRKVKVSWFVSILLDALTSLIQTKSGKKSTGLEIDMVAWKEPDLSKAVDEFCYAEASSDDEFAQKHFILPSNDEGAKKRKKGKGIKKSGKYLFCLQSDAN